MNSNKSNVSYLEHVNLTVSDVQKSAQLLCEIFDWKVRWQGKSINGGNTIHVGTETSYLALYAPQTPGPESSPPLYSIPGSLNHIAVVVEDLDAIHARVEARGLKPFNHADYEPGRRFYFLDEDQTEFEVVSYERPPSKVSA